MALYGLVWASVYGERQDGEKLPNAIDTATRYKHSRLDKPAARPPDDPGRPPAVAAVLLAFVRFLWFGEQTRPKWGQTASRPPSDPSRGRGAWFTF